MKVFSTLVALLSSVAVASSSSDNEANHHPRSLRGEPKATKIMLYYQDELIRSVATPAAIPGRGVDPLYVFPGTGCTPVAQYAPGDTEYSGGRWAIYVVSGLDADSDGCITNAADILADESLSLERNSAADFVCPLQP